MAELVTDDGHGHGLRDELGRVRVAQLVRHDAPLDPGPAAALASIARAYWGDIGPPTRVHSRTRLRMPASRRLSAHRWTVAIAPGSRPTVRGLWPLPSMMRTVPRSGSTSAGRSARASLIRSPPRYSSVIRARFRMPVLEAAEHAAISAPASARDRTSAR